MVEYKNKGGHKMRKLLVALLLGAVVGVGLKTRMAEAQFIPPSGCSYLTQQAYCSQAQGTPSLILNSPGSNYGQVFGSNGQVNNAYTFSLGYGSTLSSNGTQNLSWNTLQETAANGRLILSVTQAGTGNGGGGIPGSGLFISSVIPNTSSFVNFITSGTGSQIQTATPSISTVASNGLPISVGSFLVLGSTASSTTGGSLVLQDNGSLSGSLLSLPIASMTVNNRQSASFIFMSDGLWHYVGRAYVAVSGLTP